MYSLFKTPLIKICRYDLNNREMQLKKQDFYGKMNFVCGKRAPNRNRKQRKKRILRKDF